MLRRALFVAGLTLLLLAGALGLAAAAIRLAWDEVPPPPAVSSRRLNIAPPLQRQPLAAPRNRNPREANAGDTSRRFHLCRSPPICGRQENL